MCDNLEATPADAGAVLASCENPNAATMYTSECT